MLCISKFDTGYKCYVKYGALGRSRTDNHLFTKQAHNHCATKAKRPPLVSSGHYSQHILSGDIHMVKPYWEGNHGVEPGSYLGIEPNLSSVLLSLDLHQLSERPRMGKMFKELSLL